jgi:hypothetical protein
MDHLIWKSLGRLAVIVDRLDGAKPGDARESVRYYVLVDDKTRGYVGLQCDRGVGGLYRLGPVNRGLQPSFRESQIIDLGGGVIAQIVYSYIPDGYYSIPYSYFMASLNAGLFTGDSLVVINAIVSRLELGIGDRSNFEELAREMGSFLRNHDTSRTLTGINPPRWYLLPIDVERMHVGLQICVLVKRFRIVSFGNVTGNVPPFMAGRDVQTINFGCGDTVQIFSMDPIPYGYYKIPYAYFIALCLAGKHLLVDDSLDILENVIDKLPMQIRGMDETDLGKTTIATLVRGLEKFLDYYKNYKGDRSDNEAKPLFDVNPLPEYVSDDSD